MFLGILAEALGFTDYFGMNWDALNDSLSDVDEPTEIVWTNSERFAARDPEGFAVVVDIFEQTDTPVSLRFP
jgi:RNAse (barnase) inhibitor barstar